MAVMERTPLRVLIVRPSALGDVARTVAALVSIKRRWPGAAVDWLVRDSFAEVIAHHPDLGAVVPFPRARFDRFWRSPRVMGEVFRYCDALWRRDYDLAVDLQGLGRSGWFTWSTRAQRRVGPADAREGAWLGYTRWVRIDPDVRHTVDRMLAVVAGAGAEPVADLRLYCGERDRAWASDWMAREGLEPGRYAVIAPTARWLCKCWPAERYARVASSLGERGFGAVAVIGAEHERGQIAALLDGAAGAAAGGVRRIDLVGMTTIGQMMALIEGSGLMVGNDSAALHIAVGLNRRCVGVFGPTDPAAVGPYRYDAGVVRPAESAESAGVSYRSLRDDRRLISTIPAERVVERIDAVLAGPAPLDGMGTTHAEQAALSAD